MTAGRLFEDSCCCTCNLCKPSSILRAGRFFTSAIPLAQEGLKLNKGPGLLLSMCASPQASHALRTLPPSESRGYADAYDAAIWDTFRACIGGPPEEEKQHAWSIASLPAVLGGLGLHSAQPCHPAPRHTCVPRQGLRPAYGLTIPTEPRTTLLPADMQVALHPRAALRMGVEEQSTDIAITHSRAPAQVCSPGRQRSWNMRGCVSRARRWERMARLSPSSGLHTLQPQTLELKTVGGLTSSCTEPHRTAAPCAAAPRLHPCSRGL